MPVSQKRVAANRANAAKSTGPRTPEGKEKAKLNAIVHGLTAQTAVLPGEDRGELEALSQALMKQLSPRGLVQRLIAGRVVSLAWKLRRVARAEEAIADEMNSDEVATWDRKREFNDNLGFEALKQGARPRGRNAGGLLAASFAETNTKSGEGRLIRLTQYELKLDAALRSAVRELRSLQREDDFDMADETVDAVAETPGSPKQDVITQAALPEPNEPNAPLMPGRAPVAPATLADQNLEGIPENAQNRPAASPAWVDGPCRDDAPRSTPSQPDQAAPDVVSTAAATARWESASETDRSDKTNPAREPDAPAPGLITDAFPQGNSSPTPQTSASPPPGPRR